jgi:hypothetical protein
MTNNIDKQSFGQAGLVLVAANTEIPAGQYCALSFLGGGGLITTAFPAAQAPLVTGTQTGIAFADGYTIFTPLNIPSGSAARINCPVAVYKAL